MSAVLACLESGPKILITHDNLDTHLGFLLLILQRPSAAHVGHHLPGGTVRPTGPGPVPQHSPP